MPVHVDRPRSAPRLAALLATLLLAACSSTSPPVPRNALQTAALSTSQSAARALARGDLAQARLLYERALASADAVEDFSLAGALLINLALVHQRQAERLANDGADAAARGRELAAAQARAERVTAAPQRYGASLVSAAALRRAMVFLDAGDTSAAADWATRADAACAAPCEHAATLAVLQSQLAWGRGDAAGSIAHAERGLAAALATAKPNEQANALRQRGRARAQLGQHADAAADLAQALTIDQQLGLPERIALDLLWAGDVEQRRGRAAAAREFYERAGVVYRAANATAGAAQVEARLRDLR